MIYKKLLTDICVLDFETTGLEPATDRVVEMAAIRVINRKEVLRLDTLVDPDGVPLHPEAQKVNGLTPAEVSQGMPAVQAFSLLKTVIGEAVVIAHNAAFDLAFLQFAYQRHRGDDFTNDFLCTRTVAANRYPYPHNLPGLCQQLGITHNNAHRAMGDAEGTYALFQQMQEEYPCEGMLNVLGFNRKYGPPKWVPANAVVEGY